MSSLYGIFVTAAPAEPSTVKQVTFLISPCK
jgi:hypothetical protein